MRDRNCKCGYINETELIGQLQKLIDTIELNETDVLKKIKNEVTRYKRFQRSLLGEKMNISVTDIDVKEYVKFLLKDGNIEEKRKILSCFNSTILLSQKKIELAATTRGIQ